MKITRLVKTAIKWGPVILPVVMKLVSDKKQSGSIPKRKR